jgi:hypothetical protein
MKTTIINGNIRYLFLSVTKFKDITDVFFLLGFGKPYKASFPLWNGQDKVAINLFMYNIFIRKFNLAKVLYNVTLLFVTK